MKFTKGEKKILKAMGVTMNDVHKSGSNCVGTVYGLYNPCYLVECTFNGSYTKHEIYHELVDRLFTKMEYDDYRIKEIRKIV